MDPAVVSLVVLGCTVALFLWNRLPVGVVAIFTALALYATGVLDVGTALGGFGDPVVVFVASLFVVSEALDATGVTTWAGQVITERAGTGRRALLIAVMLLAAVLTALVSPNGAVAALLPMVVVIAVRNDHPPSKMLIPLAFAAHAGSLLALTGSPVNVIVSDAAVESGAGRFGFFEYALVGLPLVAATVVLCTLLGERLLPSSASASPVGDLSRQARVLSGHYALQDGFYRLGVRPGSPLIGSSVPADHPPGMAVLGVQRPDGAAAPPNHMIVPGDVIVVSGPATDVLTFAEVRQLDVGLRPVSDDALVTREAGVVEVVVAPRSPLVGERVFPGMVRMGELVVLAVRHRGRETGTSGVVVTEGDSLVLHGPWAVIDSLLDDRDVLIVDSPETLRRQTVPLGLRSAEALGVLVVMVVLLATGVVPPAVAGLGAAAAMVLLRVVSPPQAYRAVSWQTVVLLGGLIPLSTAISDSGAADLLAGALLGSLTDASPYLLLLALFLVTAALGQVVSNTATVLIVVPIALAAASDGGVAVEPVLMTVAVAGAASFLTPIATPANMMIMGPGGYRFGDYWRLGAVLLVTWLVIALVVIPVVWPFR
ncbi:SLC13 family permease [Actinotalea sp. K2]|uniref:SLC13 family permease n=1 Tax=Actinotalea sp. K2 TaxID=2939438 RepID=UPI0020176CA8|nr:SLC13 family permease [Actinotalea sp. K2]MCL3861899.1 SLC13 family permease [Actinotalea sp. K2]